MGAIDSYCSDDYAGIKGGDWTFYYGYESADSEGNWLFEAKHNGACVLICTAGALGMEQDRDPLEILARGVATALARVAS